MMNRDICPLCGLPVEAAISGLPLLAGAVAGSVAGCLGQDSSAGRRVLRSMLALGLTAAGAAGFEMLTVRVCRCHDEDLDEHLLDEGPIMDAPGIVLDTG